MEHPRNVLKLLLSAFQPVYTMPAFKGCPVTGHTIPYHNHLHTRPSSYFTFARERRGSAAVRLTSPRRKDRWSDLLGIATVHGSIDSNRRPAHIPDRPCLVVRPPGTDIESAPSIILVAIPLRATSFAVHSSHSLWGPCPPLFRPSTPAAFGVHPAAIKHTLLLTFSDPANPSYVFLAQQLLSS